MYMHCNVYIKFVHKFLMLMHAAELSCERLSPSWTLYWMIPNLADLCTYRLLINLAEHFTGNILT